MRIGEIAEATGVSPRSLRYYEEQGLIRSARTPGGWRDFDPSTVERVVMIQHLDQEVAGLEAKRRDVDRELDVLTMLRRESVGVLGR